jgi:osmotically-inducible protein OsmY
MGNPMTFLAGAAVGAAAAYFLDPQGGARRRHEARDKTVSKVKSGASDAASSAKYTAGKAQGAVHSVTPSMPGHGDAPDDATLVHKVESEIFRAADAPKGSVSVNAENGVVFLRGVVDDRDWIQRLGSDAKKVEGVKEVRNLLHLPGTEAPVAPATR